jgi:hypothetical protein
MTEDQALAICDRAETADETEVREAYDRLTYDQQFWGCASSDLDDMREFLTSVVDGPSD